MAAEHLTIVADKIAEKWEKRKRPPALSVQWSGEIKPRLRDLYLVKGLLPSGIALGSGQANSGKTAVFGDLALHLAAGLQYRGKRTRACFVVWIALEAPESWNNRVVAWCLHHGIEPGELRLATITGRLDLRHANSVRELIDVLAGIEARADDEVGLVVIDTLARAMPGANENAGEDMGAAVASLARVSAEISGASVLLIHHRGKDETRGPRGHSSLIAAVDSAFEVKNHELIVEKARDAKIGEALAFELIGKQIGVDEDGDPVTAVVAVPTDAPIAGKASAPRRLTDGSKTALKVLRQLLRDQGVAVAGLAAPAGTVAVSMERWREEHRQRYGGSTADADTTGAERHAWRRALEQLQAASIVTVAGPWVYAHDRKPHA